MGNTREGGRAYLLITFDLPNQRMLSTEEVVGSFDAEFQPVAVDWGRVISMINVMADKHPPKKGPWRPKEDVPIPPIGPPWNRASVDDEDDEEAEEPPNV